jgi:putative endonuclease
VTATRATPHATTPSVTAEREWWLYVLECKGGSLYTGIAVDVARRYAQHCRGVAAAYTRIRPPLRLVGAIRAGTRSSALKLECAFKKLPAREKHARAAAMGAPAPTCASAVIDVSAPGGVPTVE